MTKSVTVQLAEFLACARFVELPATVIEDTGREASDWLGSARARSVDLLAQLY